MIHYYIGKLFGKASIFLDRVGFEKLGWSFNKIENWFYCR